MEDGYPLDTFLEDREIFMDASGGSITTFRNLCKSGDPEDQIGPWIESIVKLPARWPPGGQINLPGKFSTGAMGNCEVAIQRKINERGQSQVAFGDQPVSIQWIDVEVPVDYVPGKARRSCPDLVGWIEAEKATVIVDIKYAPRLAENDDTLSDKYYGDTPLLAAFKTVYYGIVAWKNREKLRRARMFHSNSKAAAYPEFCQHAYNKIRLLVAADEGYWSRWNKYVEARCETKDAISRLEESIKNALEKHSDAFASFDFISLGTPEVQTEIKDVEPSWARLKMLTTY